MPKTHQHILVPVDFSNHATLALEEAADLAHKYQADLTVVYVIPQAIFHPDWAADMEDAIDVSDITEEAKKVLTDMVAPYRQEGLSITEHVLSGGPYIEIVRMAQRIKANRYRLSLSMTWRLGKRRAGDRQVSGASARTGKSCHFCMSELVCDNLS